MSVQGIHFPSINDLMDTAKIKSRYQLVVAAGIRAREVDELSNKYSRYKNHKKIGLALEEIYLGEINPDKYAEFVIPNRAK